VLGNRARRLADRERDHRPHALSTRLDRIAERLLETTELGCEGELGEVALDERT